MLITTSVRRLFRAAALGAALTACTLPPAPPLQDHTLLAVAGTVLYTIDLHGREDTALITLTPPATVTDVARDPRTGDVYVVSSARLYRADLRTGDVTAVGGRNMNALNALTFSAGQLFAGDEYGGFYRLDPVLGVAIRLNETPGPEPLSGDLAAAPDGTLYATLVTGSSDRLVTVDPLTGAVHPVGLTGFDDIYGLSFRSGTLYGMTSGGDLLTLDRQTGRGRLLRSTGIRHVYGLD